jgi:hypothetical protein
MTVVDEMMRRTRQLLRANAYCIKGIPPVLFFRAVYYSAQRLLARKSGEEVLENDLDCWENLGHHLYGQYIKKRVSELSWT